VIYQQYNLGQSANTLFFTMPQEKAQSAATLIFVADKNEIFTNKQWLSNWCMPHQGAKRRAGFCHLGYKQGV